MSLSLAVMLVGILTGPAAAQDREFAFGIGYGHLFWDGHNTDELEEQGGLVLDGRLTWALSPGASAGRPQLRMGVDLGLAFYVSNEDGDDFDIIDGEIFADVDDFTQLSVISPGLELSLRQPVAPNWYLEPGVRWSLLVGNYVKGEEFFGFVDEDVDRSRAGVEGRAFLRLGFGDDRWSAGLEGSYGYGWLDFGGDIGGDIQQGYLGFFYGRRF